MATAIASKSELPPVQPRTWKNRFLRKGSGKDPHRVASGADSGNTTNWHSHYQAENANNVVADRAQVMRSSFTNSGPEAQSQRSKKGGAGFIRKLKTLNGSFRKDGHEFAREDRYPSVLQESESSPSNPQSPYSTESFVSVEVRAIIIVLSSTRLCFRSDKNFHIVCRLFR